MKHLVTLALVFSGAAHAQFRCVAPDGSVSIQQTLCPANAASEPLKRGLGLPTAEDRARSRLDTGVVKPRIGMLRSEAIEAFGRPDRSAQRVSESSTIDVLAYDFPSRTIYVSFRNGAIVRVEESARASR